MKNYCFDTSGLSNPLESMPEDIHESMWAKIMGILVAGEVAVNTEIYEEMLHLPGKVGQCIADNKTALLLEINDGAWNWQGYVAHTNAMNLAHHDFISEYCGGTPKTVCLKDVSIIALAKTLAVPLVHMETYATGSTKKRRIPDVCKLEGVKNMTFSEFLRAKNIKL